MTDAMIANVRMVLPDSVEVGTLTIEGGRIHSLRLGGPPTGATGPVRDGRGCWLLPGLVDLHNDGMEQEIEPRPRATFPIPVALQAMENRLVSHGITTIFHSFSFMDGREGTLEPQTLMEAIREISRLRRTGVIRHLVHARYEVIEVEHAERIRRLIREGLVHLVSFMNHTPGQGQYTNVENFIGYYTRKYHLPVTDLERLVAERQEKSRNPAVEESLRMLVREALEAGLPLASHDDDSPEKILSMRGHGVGIAEFPVGLSAALAASEQGMHVAVGAPNLLRGGSTSGNLSALEAITAGAADILCSDYFAPAMLPVVFALHRDGVMPLPSAVRMVTLNPARAAGLETKIGSLEVGKQADLILVSNVGGIPAVIAAWAAGKKVFEKHDSAKAAIGEELARGVSPSHSEEARVL